MPNWAGSCWYELRYLDPANDERFVDPDVERYWMGPNADRPLGGVELYVGGVEHAVLHLLYARFWHKVLFDLGYLTSSEPFHRLVNQGMLQLPAYTTADGFYVPAAEVEESDGRFFHQGVEVRQEFGKIGKSLKNVVTPDEFIASLRRRHLPAVRDVRRPAGGVSTVGRQDDHRAVPAAAARVAGRRRRADRRGARHRTTRCRTR